MMTTVNWWKSRKVFWWPEDRRLVVQVGKCGNVGKAVHVGAIACCDSQFFLGGEQFLQSFDSAYSHTNRCGRQGRCSNE